MLIPSRFDQPVAGQPAHCQVLATWCKIPAQDRYAIGQKTVVRTSGTVIRQDRVTVGLILSKLGDYPTIFLTPFDPRHDPVLDMLRSQRNLWHIVWCGGDQIRRISSDNDDTDRMWLPIQQVVAGEPDYTADQYLAAEAALLARSTPAKLWREVDGDNIQINQKPRRTNG